MTAFITGSHAYGTPTEASDIDLVILCDEETRSKLDELKDRYPEKMEQKPIRFGRLNLIVVTSQEEYEAWKEGTDTMSAQDISYDSAAAHDVLHACHLKRGIEFHSDVSKPGAKGEVG